MSPHLKRLKDLIIDLVEQLNESSVVLDQRHFRMLLHLSSVEKLTLAKTALEWNWNVGSPVVMKFLQKSHILSMSELMVHTFNNQNAESAQLIFGDLLETEPQLLADLLMHANSADAIGLLLCEVLSEGFKRLVNDIIENPSVLAVNYLEEVEEYLHDECIEDVRLMHFKLLLENGPKHSTTDAIISQCAWNNEPIENHLAFKLFLMSIVGRDVVTRQKTFQEILTKCGDWTTEIWKYLLLLLRMAIETEEFKHFGPDEHNKFKAIAKKFVKDTFKRSIDEEDENGLHVLFLVARQITKYNESLLGNYAAWFKKTIGEMKYELKNAEFTTALNMLAGMLHMESNDEILDVHIKTYIPAPPRCNQLVLNYIELCKSRKMHLQCPTMGTSSHKPIPVIRDKDEDVFVIDDDSL